MIARLFFLGLLAIFGLGCKTETISPGIADESNGPGRPEECVDHDGDGYGAHCSKGPDCDDSNAQLTNQCYACTRPAPSCACATEGERTSCGKVVGQVGQQTTCASGEMVCTGGAWGECLPDGKFTSLVRASRHALGLGQAAPCTGNPCDPYCRQFPDTPDDTLSTAGGLVGTDAGLTLEIGDGGARPIQPDGPMPGPVRGALQEAGLLPLPDAGVVVYHELLPTTTATDTIVVPAQTKTVDVYFLDSTTGTSSDALTALEGSLRSPGGVVDRVKSAIPDAWFGVGRYEQYDFPPWNSADHNTVAYEHLLSMTGDTSAVGRALAWSQSRLFDPGFATPRSWAPALFALATTSGLPGATGYWVLPRNTWSSPENTESGPCPAGRVGYPCFRPSALPITVLIADSPSNNGPGGQYAYVRRDWLNVQGATPWSTAVENVSGNGTEAAARSIDVAHFATYGGNTAREGTANQSWQWPPTDDCTTGSYSLAKNVFFTFHTGARTPFHFDTWGSSFDTVLYLYRRGGAGVACNVQHFAGLSTLPIASSIDGEVEAGDYVLVVDGRRGASGDYVLHVNAMPDGAGARVPAEPNYDEALDAYRSIGGQVVTVDTSGYACDDGPTTFLQRNTGRALDRLSFDTSSLDAQIAGAIVGLAEGRFDLSAVAVDADDLVDFDGPPGGSTILTPNNVDDATFVQAIVTVPTTETMTNCRSILADRFVGCLPGTRATFSVTFRPPPSVPQLGADQIFTLALRTLRNDSQVISETPVVIVVPGSGKVPRSDAWFVRDYDTTDVCTSGTVPYWGFFAWNARTQGDSHIEFDVAVAPSLADLAKAPIDPLVFSDPPGPATLAGQPISVRSGNPDTQTGGAVVDATLLANRRARTSRAMRLRAHLVASPDRTFAPLLKLWNQSISCQPAE